MDSESGNNVVKNDINPENDGQEKIVKLENKIARIERENSSLVRYNEQLCGQVQLMNAKFELAKNFLFQSVSTQTDICIPSEEENSDVFMIGKTVNIVDQNNVSDLEHKKIKSDLDDLLETIKSEANLSESTIDNDYCYDAKSKTYYSRSTGWYYYPESSAFYNPQNKSYYSYDSKTKRYKFLYSLDSTKEGTVAKKSTHDNNTNEIIVLDSEEEIEEGEIDTKSKTITQELIEEEEEGEIIESDVIFEKEINHNSKSKRKRPWSNCETTPQIDNIHTSSSSSIIVSKPLLRNEFPTNKSVNEEDMPSLSTLNRIAPVRLIVLQSDSLQIGSLLLVTCMGGKFGQHSNCTVTIPDSTISQLHAEITYDHVRQIYTVQDLLSRNGTYVNDKRLKHLERNPLFHGDVVRLADSCQLLAHIHQHRDVTCEDCEPGNAMSKYESNNNTNVTESDNPVDHRKRLKSLKKKYGLNNGNNDNSSGGDGAKLPFGYKDRAAKRQREVGSDNPYEKTAAGSALDMPLDQRNKGFRMLEKMGWKTGQALGTQLNESSTEPIDIEVKENRHGLGFGNR